jgi:hypothetical protein
LCKSIAVKLCAKGGLWLAGSHRSSLVFI